MAESPPVISLDGLPYPVLCSIVEALCPHCTPDPKLGLARTSWNCGGAGGGLTFHPDARIATLAALARTCWAFNKVATPALYHQPTPSLALIRTLSGKPDLRRHVANLYCDVCELEDPDDDDKALLLRLAAEHAPDGRLPRPPPGVFVYPHGDNGWPHETAAGFLKNDRNWFVQSLLIPICPNLEDVFASLGYGAAFPFSGPGTLPRLRHLQVSHTDTELGTDMERAWPLLAAAPHLERFWGYAICSVPANPPLQHVRDLRFLYSSFGLRSLISLLRACPRLERFSYDAGGVLVGDYEFSPREAQRALLRYAPALKHLSLSFGGLGLARWDFDDAHEHLGPEDDLGDDEDDDGDAERRGYLNYGLARLSSLEALSIDEDCLGTLTDDKGVPYVSSVIPPSVTLFEYDGRYMRDWETAFLQRVRGVATLAPIMFPRLRTIGYGFRRPLTKDFTEKEVRDILEETGVEVRCLTEDWCQR